MIYTTASLALIAFGIWEALLLFGVLVLLFGAKKIPELAKGIGSGIRNFKGELNAPRDETTQSTEEKK
ncbi:MAG: twin-arginine translocase TatA/TatE family subunit [Gemmatimonadetes bacterium]|nr:twin-arginine translocase TatA/TatE family subunit [Gemmatimonadota bacterium]